jgi:hypothetical protein
MPWTIISNTKLFRVRLELESNLYKHLLKKTYIGEDVKLISVSSSTSPGPSKLCLIHNIQYFACDDCVL